MGSWIAKRLCNKYEIIGLSRTPNGSNYKQIKYDLQDDFPDLKFDVAIHLAAMSDKIQCENNPKLAEAVNVTGTKKVLEACKKNDVERLVYISTGGVYGYQDEKINESSRLNLEGVYAKTKYAAEQECLRYRGDFPITIARLFFPYGPKTNPKRMISSLIKRINSGKPIYLNNRFKPKINPIYIGDLTEVISLMVEKGEKWGVYNVAGDEIVDMRELSERIGEKLGKKPVFKKTYREVGNYIADTAKLKDYFGYVCKHTLDQGLTLTMEGIR